MRAKIAHAFGLLFAPLKPFQGLSRVIAAAISAAGLLGFLGGLFSSVLVAVLTGTLVLLLSLLVLSLFALYKASPPTSLRVFLDETSPLSKPCGGAPFELDRGAVTPCLFYNVLVGNASKRTLSGCYGTLLRVDKVEDGNLVKHEDFANPIPLRWTNEEMGVRMAIYRDTPIQLGLVRGVDDPDPVLYVETEEKSTFGKSRELTPGDYRLTVRADSDDSPSADGVFFVSFSGEWDGIEVVEWHDPPTPAHSPPTKMSGWKRRIRLSQRCPGGA